MIRQWIAAALLAAVCATTACTQTSVSTTTASGRNTWTEPGHLRIGTSEEPDSLVEWFAHTQASDEINSLLFEPVFRYNDKGDYIPGLATIIPSYANGGISRDSKTITLHLRADAKWSDGAPEGCRDLQFTWKTTMSGASPVKLRLGWDDIASLDCPTPHTAVLHLIRPDVAVLGILGGGGGAAYPPMPEHLLAASKDLVHDPYMTHPIGSGPFTLASWNHGASLEFVANPTYWRGRPKLDRITIRIVPNSDTLFAQLQTHEVDVYDGVTENQVPQLSGVDGVRVVHRLIANERHLQFNLRKPILADRRVRLAVAEGVNWDRLNDRIYHGINERASSDILPSSWAAPSIPFYRYDPKQSASLLDAAGWKPGADGWRTKNGNRLTFSISTGTNRQANEQAEVQIQSELKDLGIELTVINYPVSLLFSRTGPLYSGTYDTSWTIDTYGPDPENQANWGSTFMPPNGANTSFLNDPVVDDSLRNAAHTFDRTTRKRLYQRAEERIHDLVPTVFLYWENAYAGYNSDLKGYKPAQYIANAWNAWEWEI